MPRMRGKPSRTITRTLVRVIARICAPDVSFGKSVIRLSSPQPSRAHDKEHKVQARFSSLPADLYAAGDGQVRVLLGNVAKLKHLTPPLLGCFRPTHGPGLQAAPADQTHTQADCEY